MVCSVQVFISATDFLTLVMDLLGFTDEEVKEINSKALKGKPKPSAPEILDAVELPDLTRFPTHVQEAVRDAYRLEMAKRRMREANELARTSRSDPPKGLVVKVDKAQRLIKRLKSLGEVNPESLMQEITSLNLTRFVQEVVNSLCETKFASKDIPLMVEICNHMHQRYGEFAKGLEQGLVKTYHASDFLRKRHLLRLLSELIVSGVFHDNLGFFGRILKDLTCTTGDQDVKINYMHILATFLKFRGEEFTGNVPGSVRRKVEAGEWLRIERQDVIQRSTMDKIRTLITEYYPKGQSLFRNLHQSVLLQDAKNKRLRMERGVIDQENLEQLSTLRNLLSKVHGNLQVVADLLGEELEPLDTGEGDTPLQDMEMGEEDISQGLFESDEDREMYDNLKKIESAEVAEDEKKPDNCQFEDIIKRLPQCVTIKQIDEFAQSFSKIAFKQNRKKLVNVLFSVSRNSLSLLPFYSRLVATLAQDYK